MEFPALKSLNVARVLGNALATVDAPRGQAQDAARSQALKAQIAGCYETLSTSGFDVGWNWGIWDDDIYREIAEQIPGFDSFDSDGYSEQLYVYMLRRIPRHDGPPRKILEVGSGSGMGLHFLSRLERQSAFVGVDLCQSAVDRANATYARPGTLRYVQGDAEQLPFESNAFDIVINVESSHNYPNLGHFFSEVARVLRPGGYFSHADVFTDARYAVMTQCKRECEGLDWLEEHDISEPVKAAVRRRMQPDSTFRRKIRGGTSWPGRWLADRVAMQSWGACLLENTAQPSVAHPRPRATKVTGWNIASFMRSYRHTLARKPAASHSSK